MSKKIAITVNKPFVDDAYETAKKICEEKGYELEIHNKYGEKEDLIKILKNDVDAFIVRSDKIREDIIAELEDVKVIVRGGAGYDNIDTKAAAEKDIVVMNTPGQNSNAVAELAFGFMVYITRNLYNGTQGTELLGKKIGIHAYGNIGKNVARIAKGFGMEVCAFDPFVDKEEMEADGVKYMEKVEDMYAVCDYISLNLPSVDATKESINYDLFSKLPKNAKVVNTARKEVIHEGDLKKIMSEREDLCYVSDIAPVCKDELLEKYPNRVFFTPKKMGAQTKEANINACAAGINQIIAYFEDNDTTFKVN